MRALVWSVELMQMVMTREWLFRAFVVTLCATLGAYALSEIARLFNRQRRWAWFGAMWVTALLPFFGASIQLDGPLSRAIDAWFHPHVEQMYTMGIPQSVNVQLSHVQSINFSTLATVVWIVGSIVTLMGLAWFSGRFHEMRAVARRTIVNGVTVFVSDDIGPAVVGVLRPAIVLPKWVLQQTSLEQRLITLHESEHLRAGDSRLLAMSAFALVVMPWNPLLWWQFFKLRNAVETDCDARVLANGVDPREYGHLLLNTAAHFAGLPTLVPALGGPSSLLTQRIIAMTQAPPKFRNLRAAALTAIVTLIGAVAIDGASSVAYAQSKTYVHVSSDSTADVTYTQVGGGQQVEGNMAVKFSVDSVGGDEDSMPSRKNRKSAMKLSTLIKKGAVKSTPATSSDAKADYYYQAVTDSSAMKLSTLVKKGVVKSTPATSSNAKAALYWAVVDSSGDSTHVARVTKPMSQKHLVKEMNDTSKVRTRLNGNAILISDSSSGQPKLRVMRLRSDTVRIRLEGKSSISVADSAVTAAPKQ